MKYEYVAQKGSEIRAPQMVAGVEYEMGVHAEATTYPNAEWTAKSVSITQREDRYSINATIMVETEGGAMLAEFVESIETDTLTIPAEHIRAMTQEDGSIVIPLSVVQSLIEAAVVPLAQGNTD